MVASNEIVLGHLRKLAANYRQRGYRVTIYPGDEDLPAFLKGNDIDLLAQNGKENVVVAVKSSARLAGSPLITRLAELTEDRPDWRFELVVTGSRAPVDDTSLAPAVSLDVEEVPDQLAEASMLRRKGHAEAAHLLAWAAVEALMRDVLDGSGIVIQANSPLQMIKSLYAYGLVSRSDYEMLVNALEQRNAAVHGYKLKGRKGFNTRSLIGVADRLARQAVTQ